MLRSTYSYYCPQLALFGRDSALGTQIEECARSSVSSIARNSADDAVVPDPVICPNSHYRDQVEHFPALCALGLENADLQLLRRQGYLEFDRRSAGGSAGCWRLRFRREGRLRTVYVGTDDQRLDRVRRELAAIQFAHRQHHQQAQMLRLAKQLLKRAKAQAAPMARQVGFHFHGRVLRRNRKAR